MHSNYTLYYFNSLDMQRRSKQGVEFCSFLQWIYLYIANEIIVPFSGIMIQKKKLKVSVSCIEVQPAPSTWRTSPFMSQINCSKDVWRKDLQVKFEIYVEMFPSKNQNRSLVSSGKVSNIDIFCHCRKCARA